MLELWSHQGGSVSEVELTVTLPASADRVWRAWTEPRYLGQWISGHAQVDATVHVGGGYRLTLPSEREPLVISGVYLTVDEYTGLAMTWSEDGGAESQLEIQLADAGDPKRTRLTLTHRGLAEDAVEEHRTGWREMLAVLEEYLAL